MRVLTFSPLIIVSLILFFLWLGFASVGAGQGESVGPPSLSAPKAGGESVEPKRMAETSTPPKSSLPTVATVSESVRFADVVLVLVFLALAVMIFNMFRGKRRPEPLPKDPVTEEPLKVSLIFPQTLKIEAALGREMEEDSTLKMRLEALEKTIKMIVEEQKAAAEDLADIKKRDVYKSGNLETHLSGPTSLANRTPKELKEPVFERVSDEEEVSLIERKTDDLSGGKVCCIQVRDKIKDSPRSSGNIIIAKEIGDCRWELRGIKNTNLDLILNKLFALTRQEGVIKNTSKPAIVEGRKEEQTIHVEKVLKGILEMGGPA